jgi:hypothetical protein
MRTRLALLLGMLALAVPAVPVSFFLREAPAPPPAWPKSPPEPPLAAPEMPARWDHPARESLALLRRMTVREARRSVAALADCETRAGRITAARRNRHYRKCATAPLARTNAFATANSRMLTGLASSSGPTHDCRGRVLELSGTAGNLAFLANTTLRGGLDAPWEELLEASRGIRGLAAETLRLAGGSGWNETCRPRPKAKPPAAPVL